MARTLSNMLPLGTKCPDFKLKDEISQKLLSINEINKENGFVVFFICNHCPYVIHVIETLVEIGEIYKDKEIGFIAINSNDIINYPDDSPEKMVEFAEKYNFTFPYCFDESQEIAKSFDAACTPDIFVFNREEKLVYRGQIDDSRPGNDIKCTGEDLKKSIDNLINGKQQDLIQKPSLGCGIKWQK